jgi:CRP/FNR family transcriptional regulator
MAQLDNIIKHSRPLQRGAHFFRQGDELRALYVVKSGSVKSYITAPDGTEQVIGFYFPGELLGLDALEHRRHTSSAVTLERTALCEMPYARFEELCFHVPHMTRQILAQAGRELAHDHEIQLLMGQKGMEERLALFLVNLSLRHQERGFSATEFNLSMSRYDIANFLGVAAETVSRSLSRFEKEGLVKVDRKLVRVLDLPRLRLIAGFCGECLTTAAS